MDSRCRLCAEVYEELIEILNEAGFSSKIYQFFHVDIVFNDKLPTSICQKCYETIHATWNFNEQVQKAQEFLSQEYVKTSSISLIDLTYPNENIVVKTETVFLLNDYEEESMKNEYSTIESESEKETSTNLEVQATLTNELQKERNHREKNGVKTVTERLRKYRSCNPVENKE
ncbi:hypothetical protein FQR65_LT02707 [Abscondita terminalis]|nr:hypothetical protein FQR65_LT02707 [Abscondita terminalis]